MPTGAGFIRVEAQGQIERDLDRFLTGGRVAGLEPERQRDLAGPGDGIRWNRERGTDLDRALVERQRGAAERARHGRRIAHILEGDDGA